MKFNNRLFVVVVQSLSRVWLFETPLTAECPASLSFTISRSLLKLMSIESMMPSNHLIFCLLIFLSFSSCFQSFSASGSFPMSPFFALDGQSIGTSTLASVLPMHIQCWFPLRLTGLTLQSKGLSESSPTPQFKSINSSVLRFLHSPTLTSIHDHWKKS